MLSFGYSKPKRGSPGATVPAPRRESTGRNALVVGFRDGRLEREADRFADRVARSQPVEPLATGQAVAGMEQDTPQAVRAALDSSGRPLDPAVRASFGSPFGYDLSRIRVHSDASAAGAATALSAHAFTHGHDIFFARDQYRPDTREGRRLIAHEVGHAMQQGRTAGGSGPALVQRQPAAPTSQDDPPSTAASMPHDLSMRPKSRPAQTAPAAPDAAADAAAESRTKVREWLDREDFNLGLILDAPPKPPEQWHAFYGEMRMTLAAITDDTFEILKQTMPAINRVDVWMAVYQYYQEKEKQIKASQWQGVLQLLWTPTYNLVSTQPGPRFQAPGQVTAGATYQAHKAGYGGLEHQFAFTASGLDFVSGQRNLIENALLQYQLSVVSPVGHDFQIGGTWVSLQKALYVQAAAGAGCNKDAAKGGKLYCGLLLQPGAGGQLTLNIGSFQIIAQGTVVYSWTSKTREEGSKATGTLGGQAGIGVGGTF